MNVAPIPMFSNFEFGCGSAQRPANEEVMNRLESLDGRFKAVETYKWASNFLNNSILNYAQPGVTQGIHARCVERILNWSFLVAKKSILDWSNEDLESHLNFIGFPDSSWIGPRRAEKFSQITGVPYEKWLINPDWKPFINRPGGSEADMCRAGVKDHQQILLKFLSFVASLPGHSSSSLANTIVSDVKLIGPKWTRRLVEPVFYPHEIKWIIDQTLNLRGAGWAYNLILFAIAVACFTKIPVGSLGRSEKTIGYLSQFKFMQGNWYFVDKLGTQYQREYVLQKPFIGYLMLHLEFLGVSRKPPFPDVPIFLRQGSAQGLVNASVRKLIRAYGLELVDLACIAENPYISASKQVFPKLSLKALRRSSIDL